MKLKAIAFFEVGFTIYLKTCKLIYLANLSIYLSVHITPSIYSVCSSFGFACLYACVHERGCAVIKFDSQHTTSVGFHRSHCMGGGGQ